MTDTDGTWSIGELAGRAGVTVKTVRYYSDRGLLPEDGRSGGGHRRYGPGALARLREIRSLRALGLGVPEVARALEDEGRLADVVAGELRGMARERAALAWREASLRLLAECDGAERAELLPLLGAAALPPDTDAVVRFWRRSLPVRLPAPLVARVLDEVVPVPPDEPTPGEVRAFALLRALISDPRPERAPAPPLRGERYRPAVLYEGLAEAYDLAAAEVRAGREPGGAEALDCFAGAYALALGEVDSAGFRRRLVERLGREDTGVMARYWKLVAPLRPADRPALGLLHHHLTVALAAPPAA
ncbi:MULTISPECIES: MerR family transcriptional regulator [Streptomyces]|uniref:MerR family transcriptional regulator n=2 Tax=Streptomyces TaxID=1883 RepID=A0ABU4KBB2_9ACTN|nr:MerR family transcriptional regulator [Streptomyces roseolus]MDX2295064.1 MerR family transcriptional regulator [Streptomyces roseolus]